MNGREQESMWEGWWTVGGLREGGRTDGGIHRVAEN